MDVLVLVTLAADIFVQVFTVYLRCGNVIML